MRDFAWLLRGHEENIFSYFHLPIDNGPVEGLINLTVPFPTDPGGSDRLVKHALRSHARKASPTRGE